MTRGHRFTPLLLGGGVTVVLAFVSLATGSRGLPLDALWQALVHYDRTNEVHVIFRELRLPRTILALSAGAALGIAGTLMQAVTRNPLAEPGLLGVNAGASVAVVMGASFLGLTEVRQYIWFGLFGAGLAGVAVFFLGRVHRGESDPIRLVLAGAGLSIVLGALASLVVLNAELEVLDIFRNWGAGNLQGRGWQATWVMVLALAVGAAIAMPLGKALNILALGRDLGESLGGNPRVIWLLSWFAVLILAGAATAAAGPIGFIGLVAVHIARALHGPDNRFLLPVSGVIAAALLLAADVLGRVLAAPDEVAAGVVAALLGGPIFIHAVLRLRMVRL